MVRIGGVALLVAAAAGFLGGGCSKEEPAAPGTPVEEVGEEIAILRKLPAESSGGFTEPTRTVVRDAAGLEALWRKAASHRAPPPPAPKVDFATEMVALAAMGKRPTAGFGIEIVGARLDGGKLVLLYIEHEPEDAAASATVITHPWHMVVLPKRDGEVEWRKYLPPGERLGIDLTKR